MPAKEKRQVIIACNCSHYGLVDRSEQRRYLQAAKDADARVEIVDDLCGAVVDQRSEIVELIREHDCTIVACYERALRGLLSTAGIDMPRKSVSIVNVRKGSVAAAGLSADKNPKTGDCASGESGRWVPWYPVIDRERCRDCGLCLEFCLFGVYEKKDGKVVVSNPANCKTNCPACARICPEAAIMFPKFHESPVNGDEIDELSAARSKIKVDMEKLFGGDIYKKLAARRAKNRMSILTANASKALKEREACSRQESDKDNQ